MKIGIDARFFSSKDKGLGRYVENLVRELEKIDPPAGEAGSQSQYFIFLRKERWEDYSPASPAGGPKGSNFKKFLFKDIRRHKVDLMHFTYFRNAIFYKGRFIVTIHDLILSHVSFFKKIAYKMILKSILKKAEKIIAVSEFTKKDIIEKYQINSDKIEVIYEGVS